MYVSRQEATRADGMTSASHFLNPHQEAVNIVEKLRHDEVCTSVHFRLEIFDFLILVGVLVRMAIGVRCE